MANTCAISTRISLPNVLQKLYCSEFAPQLPRFRPGQQCFSSRSNRRPLVHHKPVDFRSFSSAILIRSLHTDSSATSQREPSVTADSPSPTQSDNISDNGLTRDPKTTTTATLPTEVKEKRTKREASTDARGIDQGPTKPQRGKKSTSNGKVYTDFQPKKKREAWQVQKDALQKKFEVGWSPPKKLSPDAIEGIRHLHAVAPDQFTTPALAEQFKVSPEAIRRILKSKWRPSEAELEDKRKRWEKRHDRIWSHLSELGLRPKTKSTEPFTDATRLFNKGNITGDGKSDE